MRFVSTRPSIREANEEYADDYEIFEANKCSFPPGALQRAGLMLETNAKYKTKTPSLLTAVESAEHVNRSACPCRHVQSIVEGRHGRLSSWQENTLCLGVLTSVSHQQPPTPRISVIHVVVGYLVCCWFCCCKRLNIHVGEKEQGGEHNDEGVGSSWDEPD